MSIRKSYLRHLSLKIFCACGLVASAAHGAETHVVNFGETLKKIEASVGQAMTLSAEHKGGEASSLISDAYFDYFEGEGLESAIALRSDSVKTSLEAQFNDLRTSLAGNAEAGALNEKAGQLVTKLKAATYQLNDNETSWEKFLSSLLILLREGFEAILIVGAISAFLIKTNNKALLKIVRHASLTAIGLSFALAALFHWVISVTAAQQELIEGLTMVLACSVLFMVGHWLIAQAESQHWVKYVKTQIGGAISSKSQKALWMTCFLAVFREGAETVLFYQALWVSSAPKLHSAIVWGFLLACIGLGFIFVAFNRGALKIPMKPFFRVTSTLLYFLSFSIAGKAIIELQAGGYLPVTSLDGWPTISALGFYPTLQNVVFQGMILAALLVSLTWVAFKSRRASHALVPAVSSRHATESHHQVVPEIS